jgi:prophage DNA circulation protein
MNVPWPLQPASFAGILFYVEAQSRTSGRRVVSKEIPKSDTGSAEDMGRRLRKFAVTGYLVYSPELMPQWETNRDQLVAALETDGTGTLQLPTKLSQGVFVGPVFCENYTVTEHQEKGGWCEIQMNFVEAGLQLPTTTNTAAASTAAASTTTSDLTTSNDVVSAEFNALPATSNTPTLAMQSGAQAIDPSTTITPSANDVVASDFGAFGQ